MDRSTTTPDDVQRRSPSFLSRIGTGVGALALAGAASATGGGGPDVSAAVDALGSVGTAVAAIGVAMLAAAAAGIVYRWVTAFLVK